MSAPQVTPMSNTYATPGACTCLPLDWSTIQWSDAPPTVPGWYAAVEQTRVHLAAKYAGIWRVFKAKEVLWAEGINAYGLTLDQLRWGPMIAPLAVTT